MAILNNNNNNIININNINININNIYPNTSIKQRCTPMPQAPGPHATCLAYRKGWWRSLANGSIDVGEASDAL